MTKAGQAQRPDRRVERVVIDELLVVVIHAEITMAEIKRVEQIAQCRAVQRNIRIVLGGDWVGEVVAAARRDRFQSPVALNKLENGNVIRVAVAQVSAA